MRPGLARGRGISFEALHLRRCTGAEDQSIGLRMRHAPISPASGTWHLQIREIPDGWAAQLRRMVRNAWAMADSLFP